MKARFILPVGIIFLLFSLPVLAGTTGKIVGVVKDKATGEPLIGVNVIVEGTTLGGTTDLDGSYLILNVPPGTYTLSFQYIGYKEVKISGVKVSVDFTTQVNAEMEESAVEIGEAIEVVAEREIIRRDLTSSQAEVTSEEIANIPSEEFEDVLQLQAGITRDEGGGFHIRGGRSSEVAFWVDGVSVTDVFDGSVAVEVENNAIQSLQVISGTFNAEYGQAMSGIINIVTKEGGERLSGSISGYVGDYVTGAGYSPPEKASLDNIYLNLDNLNASDIYNFRFSLNGPVPLTHKRVRFFVNFRRSYDDGWLYGQRRYRADGDTVHVGDRLDGTPGDNAIVPM
ncbi:MAG: TonB-dependent receptor, partial [Calditrichaeota bacterium]